MPLIDTSIPVRYTAPLIDYIEKNRPQWRDAALDEAGVDEAMLSEPNAAFTISQFDALWSAIRRLTGRTDLGFELGSRITAQMHGALTPLLQRCTTCDEILRLFARYHSLVTSSFFLQYRRSAEHAELLYRPAAGMSPQTLREFYEVHAVSVYMQLKAFLQERLMPYDVYMPMEIPPHIARYRALRPVRFHFGPMPLSEVRIVLDCKMLDLPINTQSSQTSNREVDLASARRLQSKSRQWSAWVILMLHEADGHQPSLEELAELISVCAHTLARHLTREGQSFRVLSNQIRYQRACELLARSQQSIAQSAYRLGYSDAANFRHAFRSISGQSPRAYRAALHASAAAGV